MAPRIIVSVCLLVCQSTILAQIEISQTIEWIAVTSATDIQDPKRVNVNDLGDPVFSSTITVRLTFFIFIKIFQQLLDGLPHD